MQKKTILALSALTNKLYSEQSKEFSDSRATPWSGWKKCLEYVPSAQPLRVLDIGCGNGRFATFLREQLPIEREIEYTGIDASSELLTVAHATLANLKHVTCKFEQTDIINTLISHEQLSNATTKFDLITIFGVLHHIPSFQLRKQLLSQASGALNPKGALWLSFWMFAEHDRFKRKMLLPSHYSIDSNDLEPADFLLSWNTANNPRYAHFSDASEQQLLTTVDNLKVANKFSADGTTENLNSYILLTKT